MSTDPMETLDRFARALGLKLPLGRTLVITGTRRGVDRLEVRLDGWVKRFGRPAMVVVGDNESTPQSVDLVAWNWAKARGYPWSRFNAIDKAYLERNQRMVDCGKRAQDISGMCTHLTAFPDDDSTGTWHCFRRGERAGLLCVDATKQGWLDKLAEMEKAFQEGF